jgi:dihydroflavonol-4-reductase
MAGAYCRGKYLAEQEAWLATDQGQRVIIVNPTVPAGPGDHWITPPTRMMVGFLNGAYPAYLESTLNVADARDIAYAHWLAAESGQPGQRYILGAHDVDLSRLIKQLGEISGRALVRPRFPYHAALVVGIVSELLSDWVTRRPPVAPLAGVRLAGVPVRFDNSRTRQQLGWTPRPLEETLRDAIADYQQRGLI